MSARQQDRDPLQIIPTIELEDAMLDIDGNVQELLLQEALPSFDEEYSDNEDLPELERAKNEDAELDNFKKERLLYKNIYEFGEHIFFIIVTDIIGLDAFSKMKSESPFLFNHDISILFMMLSFSYALAHMLVGLSKPLNEIQDLDQKSYVLMGIEYLTIPSRTLIRNIQQQFLYILFPVETKDSLDSDHMLSDFDKFEKILEKTGNNHSFFQKMFVLCLEKYINFINLLMNYSSLFAFAVNMSTHMLYGLIILRLANSPLFALNPTCRTLASACMLHTNVNAALSSYHQIQSQTQQQDCDNEPCATSMQNTCAFK